MTNPMIKEVNAETGEELEREMNAEELAQLALDVSAAQTEKETAETVAAAKAALLNRLGITADEAALLLS
jgi:hypothetical protein